MSTITTTTQLRLINNLANLGTASSTDLLLIQRNLKTFKFQYSDLVTGLPDDTTIEASSNKLRIKDLGVTTGKIANNAVNFSKMQDIGNNKLVGRTASGSGDPSEIDIITDLGSASNTNIPTGLAVTSYVTNNMTPVTPYFNVTVHQTTNLTTVDQFSSGTILSNFKKLSYGSLSYETNSSALLLDNSLLFEMNVDVIQSTVNIDLKLFGVDGSLYLYIDGSTTPTKSQIWDGVGVYNNSPKDWSFNLSQGQHTLQFVYNCFGGSSWLELAGDIIKQGVDFIE